MPLKESSALLSRYTEYGVAVMIMKWMLKLFFTLQIQRFSIASLTAVLMSVCLSACNYATFEEVTSPSTTPEKVSIYQLVLNSDASFYAQRFIFHPNQTWLSFSYAPAEASESQPVSDLVVNDDLLRIRPLRTPWAPAWDREAVVLGMNRILLSHGVESENMRVRMIAHAVVASGWKQNVWNFNAWGVRQGSWEKNWYIMPTYEEDENGHSVFVADATWRAFNNWEEAIDDYMTRISADSERPSYREAYRHLKSDTISFRTAKAFWHALGDGNYYTASDFTGEKFARLCGGVRSILRQKNI